MKRLFHVKQRYDWDCGIASIAMMTRCRYDDVFDTFYSKFPKSVGRGLSDSEFIAILKIYGVKPKIIDCVFHEIPSILFLPSKNEKFGSHAVYFCGKRIYDPNYKKHKKKYYGKALPKKLPYEIQSIVDMNDYFTQVAIEGT